MSVSRLRGHVKWFDASKGYGFLVVNDDSGDILLHSNVLRNYGRGSIFEIQETERGRQVSEIHEIELPGEEYLKQEKGDFGIPNVDGLEMCPARVKWFDKSKGFGFANIFKCDSDIFLHAEVLRHCGFSDLQPGEAVVIQVVDGPRGKMAGAIYAWDEPKTVLSFD